MQQHSLRTLQELHRHPYARQSTHAHHTEALLTGHASGLPGDAGACQTAQESSAAPPARAHFSGVAPKRRWAPEGAGTPRRSTRSAAGLSVAPPLSEKRVWRPRGSGCPRSGCLACSVPQPCTD